MENNITLIYGLRDARRKFIIVIYSFEEGYIRGVLFKFRCEFFENKFLIPFSPLFLFASQVEKIIIEVKTNLISFLKHLNSKHQDNLNAEKLNLEDVKTIIKNANERLEIPIDFC